MAPLMPFPFFPAGAPLSMAFVFFCLVIFGPPAFSTPMQPLAADLFPSSTVGSVAGLVGAAGSMGGVAFNFLVGILLTHFSYTPVFLIAGLLHPIAFLVVLGLVRKVELLKVS